MEALQWRLLDAAALERVYLDEMRRDFPPAELKPLSVILTSNQNGTAHSWGVYQGETLAAYLLMVRPQGCEISQLDYFAVLPGCRAGGLGARLLAELPAREPGARAIVIEAESPERAPDRTMAERRLGFYRRCGCVDTGCEELLFGVYYHVLTLSSPPGEAFAGAQIVQTLDGFYRQTLGEAQRKKHVRFLLPDGSEA